MKNKFKIGEYTRNKNVPHLISKVIKIDEDGEEINYTLENDYYINESLLTHWQPEDGEWVVLKGSVTDTSFTVVKYCDDYNGFDVEPYFGTLPEYYLESK